jgi:DNA-binding NarL/FixJ family response regulator
VRLIVADDAVLFREGLVRVLAEKDFDVVAQVPDADELLRRVTGLRPDVVIVDIRMPPTHTDEGLRAALEIGRRHPGVGVLVLSQYLQAEYAVRLLKSGTAGRGYVLKDRVSDLDAFAEAVRRVGSGGSVVDPQVVSLLVDRRNGNGLLTSLTVREREILAMMAEGRSNGWICEHLVLSPRTIETHVGNIFGKLGLKDTDEGHRRVLAVLAFLRAN